MARDLKLQVILDAVDKVTKPLKRVTEGSTETAKALKASRDQLRQLERAQKDLQGFRQLKRQAAESGDALKQQRERVRELSRQLRTTEGDTAALNRERDAAIKKAQELSRKYAEQTDKAQRLKTSLRETHGITGKLAGTEDSLTRKMRNANAQITEQKERLRSLAEAQRRAQQASDQFHRGVGRTNAIRGAGMTGLATGGAGLYAGARMLAPGVAYGEQMSAVQSVGRFNADDERFLALKQQSRDLGSSTAFSASEVGAGQEFLLRAGMSAEAIQTSMKDVLNLALANNTELGRTADIASNIGSGFKIDLEAEGGMQRVADVLSGTASRANVDLEMLGETMKYLGSGSDLGLTLEQAGAMAGILGNIGIQGSQAGTTMRAMMDRLTKPTAAAAGVMENLGLQIADAEGNMRPMPDILRDINKATAGLGNVQRKAALQELFGAEAGSGMAELVSKMSNGELDELIEKLQSVNGENDRMAATRSDNIGGDLKGLRSAWEEVGISITDTNEGPLRDLIQSMTTITRGVGNWIKQNPELAGGIAKAAAGLAALVAVGGAFTIMLASILGPIVTVRYGLAMLGVQTGGLGGKIFSFTSKILPALGNALLWVGRVFAIVGRAFLLNPIGLAVTAIAGAAYLIYRNWGAIASWFVQRWADVKAAFGDGIGGVMKLLLNWNPIGLLYKGVVAGLDALGIDVPESMRSLGGAIVNGFNAITRGAGRIIRGFTDAVGRGMEATASIAKRAWAPIGGWFADRWDEVRGAVADGKSGVARLLVNWSPLGIVYKGITSVLGKLGIEVPESMSTLAGAIVAGLNAAWDGITALWDWFKTAPGRAIDYVINLVREWDLLGQLEAKWTEAIDYLKSLPSRMFDAGKNVASGLADGIKSGASSVIDGAKKIASGAVDGAKDLLGIHSPSRVFRQIGTDTIAGLNQGLDQTGAEPVKRVTDMTKRLRQAGAGIALGAMSLPAAAAPAIQTPQLPELPSIRASVDRPQLPDLGTIRAPRIDVPQLPSLNAPRIDTPRLPDLPGIHASVERPQLPDLGTIRAPRIDVPKLPSLNAPRIDVPQLPSLNAPRIDVPQLPSLNAPRINMPAMPDLAALRVGLDLPELPTIDASAEPIRFDTRPPISAGAGQQLIDNSIQLGDIHISAAPGMDERQLAQHVQREVQRALADAQRQQDARGRSSMWDRE